MQQSAICSSLIHLVSVRNCTQCAPKVGNLYFFCKNMIYHQSNLNVIYIYLVCTDIACCDFDAYVSMPKRLSLNIFYCLRIHNKFGLQVSSLLHLATVSNDTYQKHFGKQNKQRYNMNEEHAANQRKRK